MKQSAKVVSIHRSSDYLMQKAQSARQSGNYLDALELLRVIRTRDKESVSARFEYAETACEAGLCDEAGRVYAELLTEDSSLSDCLFGLSLCLSELGDLPGSRRMLSIYLTVAPNGGKSRSAEEILDETSIPPFNSPSFRRQDRLSQKDSERGRAELAAGQYEAAERWFRLAGKRSPKDAECAALLALSLLAQNRTDDAKTACKAAEALRDPSPAACVALARVEHALYDDASAAEHIKAALTDDLTARESADFAAQLAEMGVYDIAAELAGRALSEFPYEVPLLHLYASSLVNEGGDRKAAEQAWARIRRIDPSEIIAEYYLARLSENSLVHPVPAAYELPAEVTGEKLLMLLQLLSKSSDELAALWASDETVRKTALWLAAELQKSTPLDGLAGLMAALSALLPVKDAKPLISRCLPLPALVARLFDAPGVNDEPLPHVLDRVLTRASRIADEHYAGYSYDVMAHHAREFQQNCRDGALLRALPQDLAAGLTYEFLKASKTDRPISRTADMYRMTNRRARCLIRRLHRAEQVKEDPFNESH